MGLSLRFFNLKFLFVLLQHGKKSEIGYGLYVLPEGKRKQQLQHRFGQYIKNVFSYRILDFTEQAAQSYARFMRQRQQAGRPMSVPYGQIAAIALANGFVLATRNRKDQ